MVVGGAALILHGYPVFTNDTDLAVTADSLHKFETLAKPDPPPPPPKTYSGNGALNLAQHSQEVGLQITGLLTVQPGEDKVRLT